MNDEFDAGGAIEVGFIPKAARAPTPKTELAGTAEVRSSIHPGKDQSNDGHDACFVLLSEPGTTTKVAGGVTEANPIPLCFDVSLRNLVRASISTYQTAKHINTASFPCLMISQLSKPLGSDVIEKSWSRLSIV